MARFLGFLSILTLFACGSEGPAAVSGEWYSLFNGKNLDGWKRLNGHAEYTVEDQAIVGSTKRGIPNTFLATEKKYRDFALEFEVMIDTFINSGVQFRSNSTDYMNGKVHGYQVEIDPSGRAWSGGIYDESRRGWLFPMGLNPGAGKAYKPLDWNKIYVEAVGSEIKTWVNDHPASYLIDEMTSEGFVALQIHSVIDRPELDDRKIKWRNIRIMENPKERRSGEFPFIVNTNPNKLSEAEKALGWIMLFDGNSVDQWRVVSGESFPDKGWSVKDGALTLEGSQDPENRGGDLVTRDEFAAFDLQLDFKLTKGANSGVKYLVTEELSKQPSHGVGLEYQLIDDENHPDAKAGVEGNRALGSLYDLVPADKPDRFVRPPGQWNHARIVVYPNNKVEHWLNYVKVASYRRGSSQFRGLIRNSQYQSLKNFGQARQGHILLQDYGDDVSFRNIKIRQL